MTQLATRLRGRTAGITYWHSSPNADRSLEKAESDLLKARLTERDFAIRDGHLRRAGSEHQGLVRLFFPIGVRGRELRDRDHCCSAAYYYPCAFHPPGSLERSATITGFPLWRAKYHSG